MFDLKVKERDIRSWRSSCSVHILSVRALAVTKDGETLSFLSSGLLNEIGGRAKFLDEIAYNLSESMDRDRERLVTKRSVG